MTFALALLWLAGYTAATALVDQDGYSGLVLGDIVYLLPGTVAMALGIWAVRRNGGRRRIFWVMLTASTIAMFAGDLTWTLYEMVLHIEPTPSPADAFYLSSPVLQVIAVVVAIGWRSQMRLLQSVFDASLITAALAWIGYLTMIKPQMADGLSGATLVSIAYPVLDIVLLMTLATLAFGGRRHVPLSVLFVAASVGASAVTDISYTYLSSLHSYVSGSWINVGWQLSTLLMCCAAVMAARHDEGDGVQAPSGRDVSLPLLIAGMATLLGLLTWETLNDTIRDGTVVVTVIAVIVMTLRLVLLYHEHNVVLGELQDSLTEQERLASTDPTTGLHTRRFFEAMLKVEVTRAIETKRNVSLIVIDLDGFRRINDQHGYTAGDDILREIAGRLLTETRSIDVLASYSGEEFVALLPETNAAGARATAERLLLAISSNSATTSIGASVDITAAIGVASLPEHADRSSELIRVADRALRTAKVQGSGRVCVGAERGDVVAMEDFASESSVLMFMRDLADEIDGQQTNDAHSVAMAAYTGMIVDELQLGPEDRWACIAATRLHDVGKVGVPDSILTKPGPLNDEEWEILRQHPRHGARIVALSSEFGHVAPIIEDHHERWDGAGYPNGKSGEDIEIGARIIAVCDSWTAMRANRPYRKALSREKAISELEVCSGSQFDPQIVEIFLRLEASGMLDEFDEFDAADDGAEEQEAA